jgi:hypothetical protein
MEAETGDGLERERERETGRLLTGGEKRLMGMLRWGIGRLGGEEGTARCEQALMSSAGRDLLRQCTRSY